MNTSVKITSIADVKEYFSNLDTPHYFVSATNFNLMNLEKWVKNWHNINFVDCYDGTNPSVMLPNKLGTPVFESIEAINSFLLGHMEVAAKVEYEKKKHSKDAEQGKVIFLFFDEILEEICSSLDLKVCLPPTKLVKKIDNKITTTEIGNEAGVASVPNALEKVSSYESLKEISARHKLGDSLVVQSAYGDSGKTTYFISNEEDYNNVSSEIEAEDKVKIMKCIRCAGTAIEGCATRAGTFVAPLLSELIGFPELTPYQGGWCGNELYQEGFSNNIRTQAQEMTEKLGNALYSRDYRGYFEVDYLIDLDTGDVYLGELNPRITGISAMTNMSDFCYETVPLFLFHLLEYSDVELTLDPKEYNQLALTEGAKSTASQVILKYTDKPLKIITAAPVSGVYTLKNGILELVKPGHDRRQALKPNEVYVMRILEKDEYAYKGGDLAILFANVVLKTADEKLSPTASELINALKQSFEYRDLTEEEQALVERYNTKSSLKGSSDSSGDNSGSSGESTNTSSQSSNTSSEKKE